MADLLIGWLHQLPRPLFVALLSTPLLLLAACASDGKLQQAVIGGRTFHLEIAADDDARFKGLSDRASIAEDGGMIFIFPDAGERYFVMRRCPIPIDILFLDPGGRIVQMYAMKPEPPDTSEENLHQYNSFYDAQFAIELRGGTLEHLKLAPGQKIDLPLDDLKRRAH